MPSISKKQQMMMGAELDRMEAGHAGMMGMPIEKVREFANTKRGGLPMAKKASGKKKKVVKK